MADDYDSPWKEAIECYFAEFLQFYFPVAHARIDWSQPITFLEQELRSVARDAELGKRFVDKLVSVAATRATTDDVNARRQAKWLIVRDMYRQDWDRQKVMNLFAVIDWMMRLPKVQELDFWESL